MAHCHQPESESEFVMVKLQKVYSWWNRNVVPFYHGHGTGEAIKSSVARTEDAYRFLESAVRNQKHSAQVIFKESSNELQKRADILAQPANCSVPVHCLSAELSCRMTGKDVVFQLHNPLSLSLPSKILRTSLQGGIWLLHCKEQDKNLYKIHMNLCLVLDPTFQ